jgi:tellurium resistance protein TerD
MIQVTHISKGSVDKNSVGSMNRTTNHILMSQDMANERINRNTMNRNITSTENNTVQQGAEQNVSSSVSKMSIPQLCKQVQKGQKVPLSFQDLPVLDVCLGWNVNHSDCDVDVSAFLLNETGKVLGDSWFVFYGQTDSPDGSVHFSAESQQDREEVSVELSKLDQAVKKIVFVLTINEALDRNLNFSMIEDAYIRIVERSLGEELVSFKMDEYYSNVISMMIGELYIHNGNWKFSAIGNGVARDLAGLCQLYGVQVV